MSANVPDVEINRFVFDLGGKKDGLSRDLQEFRQRKARDMETKRAEIIE